MIKKWTRSEMLKLQKLTFAFVLSLTVLIAFVAVGCSTAKSEKPKGQDETDLEFSELINIPVSYVLTADKRPDVSKLRLSWEIPASESRTKLDHKEWKEKSEPITTVAVTLMMPGEDRVLLYRWLIFKKGVQEKDVKEILPWDYDYYIAFSDGPIYTDSYTSVHSVRYLYSGNGEFEGVKITLNLLGKYDEMGKVERTFKIKKEQ